MEQFKKFTDTRFGEIRTIKVDGNLYFIGDDVVQALGYSQAENTISEHVEKSDITKLCVTKVFVNSGVKIEEADTMAFLLINEEGVNALISASSHPQAKLFKRWVVSEIIPATNETKRDKLKSELSECLKVLPAAKNLLKIHEGFISSVEERIAELKSEIGVTTDDDEADKSHSSVDLGSNLNKLPEHLRLMLEAIGVLKQENGEWSLGDKFKKCSCPKCVASRNQVN